MKAFTILMLVLIATVIFLPSHVGALLGLPLIGLALSTEGNYLGDWLKQDLDKELMGYTREEVTIVSGEKLTTGAVVGKITASGKYAHYNHSASDGTQSAAGILILPVDATAGDTPGAILARGPAEIDGNKLTWDSGQSAGDITAGLANLAALQIINRPGSTVTGPV